MSIHTHSGQAAASPGRPALPPCGDPPAFEVAARVGADGRLSDDCVRSALAMMRTHGVVVLTGLLSDREADVGADLIRETIDDPQRSRGAFASETDNRYRRRDFCSMPATAPVMDFAAELCRRLEGVLSAYCARSRPLLEVTTLTSYLGSSHQYVHRDPSGVVSLFAAVDDVSETQGGTVFVPGTQLDEAMAARLGPDAHGLMELYRIRCNFRILAHNLVKLWGMRRGDPVPLASGEFADRVFSTKWDDHQPNLLRFALGRNAQFSVRMLGPRRLWRLYRHRRALDALFRPVQMAPRKGTVIVYLSDLIHAGPDNRSARPRRLFSMSLARSAIDAKSWADGYAPHPMLIAAPVTFGDLLDRPASAAPAQAAVAV